MRNRVLFILVLFLGWAFGAPQEEEFVRKVNTSLVKLIQQYPQEKVYLHTDRDHYEAGDSIWFRAYLSNVYTHLASDLSRFVYVELRDRQDSLYARVKIPFRDSIFTGYVPLQDKLAQGDYWLRAYSYWMQNAGDDYLFRKKIRVLNPYSSRVQHTITYEKTKDEYVANIRFHNSRNEAYERIVVDCIQDGKLKTMRTTDQGNIQVKLDSTNFGKEMLVRFKNGMPFEYEQTLYLPDPEPDFVVSYMPEGGNLLAGCQQTVALKVIGRDGLSREVSGKIMDENGEQITLVQTVHKGMGAFDLLVKPGHRYYGLFAMDGGEQKRFDLPESLDSGVGLKLITNRDMVGYVVMATEHFPKSERLHLLIHSKGIPFLCQPVKVGEKGKFLVENLPEGILHFLLIDEQYRVYSERLCFVRKKEEPELCLTPDKSTYYIRDQVKMDMQVLTDDLSSKQGSFSVAVTDDEQVEQDSLQNHILSYFLLTSDLKGHIEDPAFYFKDRRIITLRYLDLLMMTQGWRRFDMAEILQEKYDSLAYFVERGQAISGKVKNFFGKDASQANLILFSNIGIVRMVDADADGHFMIDGIAFPDSTAFLIQGRNKRGGRSVEVVVDQDHFMEPSVKIPFNPNIGLQEDDFYKRFSKDYYYDNGMKVYILDEAVIRSKPIRKTYSFYDRVADFSFDSTKLASMRDWDIRMILQEFPGIEAYGDSVKRFGKKILLIVNDFEESLERLTLIPQEDLLSINFIRPPMSVTFWGKNGENGVITVTTNPNFVFRDRPRSNMVNFSLLGYQKKAEFYVPHYEVDSIRLALENRIDRRPTIYWNPKVCTDAQGKAQFCFPASDSFGPYTIIVEGQLSDGTICRKEKKIYLKPLSI